MGRAKDRSQHAGCHALRVTIVPSVPEHRNTKRFPSCVSMRNPEAGIRCPIGIIHLAYFSILLSLCAHFYDCVRACRATAQVWGVRAQFCGNPSTFTWVLGTELKSPDGGCKHPEPASHLTCPPPWVLRQALTKSVRPTGQGAPGILLPPPPSTLGLQP